jgi:hypothetical protein
LIFARWDQATPPHPAAGGAAGSQNLFAARVNLQSCLRSDRIFVGLEFIRGIPVSNGRQAHENKSSDFLCYFSGSINSANGVGPR